MGGDHRRSWSYWKCRWVTELRRFKGTWQRGQTTCAFFCFDFPAADYGSTYASLLSNPLSPRLHLLICRWIFTTGSSSQSDCATLHCQGRAQSQPSHIYPIMQANTLPHIATLLHVTQHYTSSPWVSNCNVLPTIKQSALPASLASALYPCYRPCIFTVVVSSWPLRIARACCPVGCWLVFFSIMG